MINRYDIFIYIAILLLCRFKSTIVSTADIWKILLLNYILVRTLEFYILKSEYFCNKGLRAIVNDIIEYLNKYFPNFRTKIHVRYELGEPYKNGTDERINQVNCRVISIFEEIFKENDEIYLVIKYFENFEDPMFGNTTPLYLFELLNGKKIESKEVIDEVLGEEIKYEIKVVKEKIKNLPYKQILSGIANYEQGREPSIRDAVYFLNKDTKILFHMYDDRGCIIYCQNKEKIRCIYNKFNNWIVEYWRELIDSFFV